MLVSAKLFGAGVGSGGGAGISTGICEEKLHGRRQLRWHLYKLQEHHTKAVKLMMTCRDMEMYSRTRGAWTGSRAWG